MRRERRVLNAAGVPSVDRLQTSLVFRRFASGMPWNGDAQEVRLHGEHEAGPRRQAEHQERAEGGAEGTNDREASDSVRQDLGRQAAAARRRGGSPGRALEDRTREQLYEQAKKVGIPGRSRMGKWELIEALRRSR
jgi:hypothetical protein